MIFYRKILKQAWAITKTNRFLWWYGLLLFSGLSLNVIYTTYRPNSPVNAEQLRVELLSDLVRQPWGLALLVVLGSLWLALYFRAKAGMLLSIKMIIDRQPAAFRSTFALARNFVNRLLGIWIAMQLVAICLGAIITTPVFYLFYIGQAEKATLLGLLGLIVFIPIAFVVSFINTLGPLFSVLFNMPAVQGIRAAIAAINNIWRKLLLFTVILAVIGVIATILALIAAGPFVILSVLSYHTGGQGWVVIPSSLVAIIIFIGCQAVIYTFHQTSWTLFFLELISPEKTEEETVSVPDSAT